MDAKSSVSANHIFMKSNGIGAEMGKPNWYVRNVAKRKRCLLIMISTRKIIIRRINMKPEEALKELSYDDTAYGGNCTYEVRMGAIKALKKQIPKKILYEDVGFDCCYDINLYACICPSCGLHIIDFSDDDVDSKCNSDNPEDMFRSSMVHHAYIGMNNYCNRCGQKLDWSEENGR